MFVYLFIYFLAFEKILNFFGYVLAKHQNLSSMDYEMSFFDAGLSNFFINFLVNEDFCYKWKGDGK